MIFIFRMPPYISKPYPITRGLSQCSQKKPLSLDDTSTLATLKKLSVKDHPDLRDIVRYVREPLEVFPKTVLHATFDVTVVDAVKSGGTINHFHWELTIKEARKNLDCVLDALGVLHQGLFHSKILLKSVQQILDEDPNERSDEVQKLQELRGHLLSLNNFLDCVLLHYSDLSCKLSSTLVKDIKRTTKKIYKVMMHLKSNKLETLIPNCMITEEDVLCSVLGLCDEFADRLRNLSVGIRSHKTDLRLLTSFLEECYWSSDSENLPDDAAKLQKMGFSKNRSNVIAKWIAEQPLPKHRSLLAWAKIYLENLFKYDIFLNDVVSKFPYEENRLNEWFTHDVERDRMKDGHPVPAAINVINTTTRNEFESHIEEKITEFRNSNPDGKLYFHGTDHKSAEDILENGIDLHMGREKCDFSHGKGFYVTNDFVYASGYAQTPAVIIFNIDDACLRRLQCVDLCGPDNHDDWKAVTEFFTSGKDRRKRPNASLYDQIENCHCIIGPITGDGIRGGLSSQDLVQICMKKKEMARVIGNPLQIVGTVFLNTRNA